MHLSKCKCTWYKLTYCFRSHCSLWSGKFLIFLMALSSSWRPSCSICAVCLGATKCRSLLSVVLSPYSSVTPFSPGFMLHSLCCRHTQLTSTPGWPINTAFTTLRSRSPLVSPQCTGWPMCKLSGDGGCPMKPLAPLPGPKLLWGLDQVRKQLSGWRWRRQRAVRWVSGS